MWVYIETVIRTYAVGFYRPTGEWIPVEEYVERELAASRVHYLNGGDKDERRQQLASRNAGAENGYMGNDH